MIIPTAKNTKTVTDLREKAVEMLEQAKKAGPTFIFHRSKPKAVMLSIEEYANMIAMLEDYLDSLKAKDLEEEKQAGGIPLGQLIKKYNLNV